LRALKNFGCVIYVLVGLMQLAAIYEGLERWLHIPWWISAVVGLTVAGIPIIGTIAGVMGAIKGWGWSLWGALALFGWPYLLYGLAMAGGGAADVWARVFRRRRDSDSAPLTGHESSEGATSAPPGKLHKSVYVVVVTVLWVAGSLVAGVGQVLAKEASSSETSSDPWTTLAVLGCGGLAVLAAWILAFVCLHRAWRTIQDGFARTTPGRAVGLMFIPLFNYYWVFQGFWGFAKDYNAFLTRHKAPSPQIATWPYMVFAISFVGLSALAAPMVGLVAWLSSCVFLPYVMNSMCNIVNRHADVQEGSQERPLGLARPTEDVDE